MYQKMLKNKAMQAKGQITEIAKQYWWVLLLPIAIYFVLQFVKNKNPLEQIKETLGTSPKISEIDAIRYANELESAMKMPGTDEDKIFEVLSNKTSADLMLIYQKFGKRINPVGTWEFLAPPLYAVRAIPHDLIWWFTDELDQEQLQRVKEIFKETTLFN